MNSTLLSHHHLLSYHMKKNSRINLNDCNMMEIWLISVICTHYFQSEGSSLADKKTQVSETDGDLLSLCYIKVLREN